MAWANRRSKTTIKWTCNMLLIISRCNYTSTTIFQPSLSCTMINQSRLDIIEVIGLCNTEMLSYRGWNGNFRRCQICHLNCPYELMAGLACAKKHNIIPLCLQLWKAYLHWPMITWSPSFTRKQGDTCAAIFECLFSYLEKRKTSWFPNYQKIKKTACSFTCLWYFFT